MARVEGFVCDGTCAGNEFGGCNHGASNDGLHHTAHDEAVAAKERMRLARKLRVDYPQNKHALEWADWIERESTQ